MPHPLENHARVIKRLGRQTPALLHLDIENHLVSGRKLQHVLEPRNPGRQITECRIHGIVRNGQFTIRRDHYIQLDRIGSAGNRVTERRQSVFRMRCARATMTHHSDTVLFRIQTVYDSHRQTLSHR